MPSGFFYFNSVDRFICYIRGVRLVFIIVIFFVEISELNPNSVDSDQTPRLRRLISVYTVCQCPFLWDARLIWVKSLFACFSVINVKKKNAFRNKEHTAD